jgi:flagellar biosynthesis/type III secretory pathway protein FliH
MIYKGDKNMDNYFEEIEFGKSYEEEYDKCNNEYEHDCMDECDSRSNEKKGCMEDIIKKVYCKGYEKGMYEGYEKGVKAGYEKAVKELMMLMKKDRKCHKTNKCKNWC